MSGMAWITVTCATPRCERTFECFLPKKGYEAYSFLCPRCYLSTTSPRDQLIVGAFYGITPNRLALIRQCVRRLGAGNTEHVTPTAYECLECALRGVAWSDANGWQVVYIKTADDLATEHNTTLGRVREILNNMSGGQSRIFTGR